MVILKKKKKKETVLSKWELKPWKQFKGKLNLTIIITQGLLLALTVNNNGLDSNKNGDYFKSIMVL